MTWDDKVTMCTYLNNEEYHEAVKILVSNLDDDAQALDMFITGYSLSEPVDLLLPLKSYLYKWQEIGVGSYITNLRLNIMVKMIKEWESLENDM